MLQALEEMQKVCNFPLKNIKYVMTDFTEANFKYWREHPNLKVCYQMIIVVLTGWRIWEIY